MRIEQGNRRWRRPHSVIFLLQSQVTSCIMSVFCLLHLPHTLLNQSPLDSFYYFIIWTSAEPCLAIVGCCLSALASLCHVNSDDSYHKLESSPSKIFLEDSRNPSYVGQEDAWIELADENDTQPGQCDAGETTSQ
jgi:hypothetical protein